MKVPVTAVCTSLPSDLLRQMIGAGRIPSELPEVDDVRYIDLPTGHWPMFSRPDELGEVLAAEIERFGRVGRVGCRSERLAPIRPGRPWR